MKAIRATRMMSLAATLLALSLASCGGGGGGDADAGANAGGGNTGGGSTPLVLGTSRFGQSTFESN